MVRFRPACRPPSLSLKNEHVFETHEDMIRFLFESWSRVVSFMGAAEPFRQEEILITEARDDDPLLGYKNLRRVCVTRMADKIYKTPQCIGFCGE